MSCAHPFYVYLAAPGKVLGWRLLGALGTEDSLSSGRSQADGQNAVSTPPCPPPNRLGNRETGAIQHSLLIEC